MRLDYDYVIVGGGMVADKAARGIRDRDAGASIAIIGEDDDPPYTRPALSKKLWTDPDFTPEQNYLGTADDTGAVLHTGTRVATLDRDARTVTSAAGDTFGYGRLLLATGGHPNTLDLPEGERVIYFRSAADYRRLRALAGGGRHVAVVGGSYIGSELAAALVQNDTRVTLVLPDDVLGASMFPAGLAEHFQAMFTGAGVELRTGRRVESGAATGEGVTLRLDDGSDLQVDAVAVGIGITPATDLAEAAGLEVSDGIVVDDHLRTSDPSVWAAGDVASYPDPVLGRTRVEHVDSATVMGEAAGALMAGRSEPYDHTPYFYSQVLGTRYEAVGTLDSSLRTVEDWVRPQEEGVVYYLDGEDRVQGVLLWNVAGARDAAREAVADPAPRSQDALRGRIRGEEG